MIQRNVTRGPVLGNFARVDFVGQIAIEHMIGPNRRAERNVRRIAAADARDDPVSFREIEARIEAQRHHRSGRARGAHAGEQAENAVAIHAHVMVASGQRNHAVEMLAFDPELIFAGSVAGVFAGLEHGDDDDFHFNRFCGRGYGLRRSLTKDRRGARACDSGKEVQSRATNRLTIISSFGISSDGGNGEKILHHGGESEIEFMASGGRIALTNLRASRVRRTENELSSPVSA